MPIDADRAAASRARMNKAVTSAWLLGVALAGVTSACTRSGVAAGLDQDTAPKVTLGMSSEAVLGALGAPLTDTYDPPDKATRRLVYARVAVLSLGSNHLMWPGLDYTVLLQDGAVV